MFSLYGFDQPPISRLIEQLLAVGAHRLGMPDTLIGWVMNSVLYGLVGASAIWIARPDGPDGDSDFDRVSAPRTGTIQPENEET